MNYSAHVVKTVFNNVVKDAFFRARKWFQEHPDEPYCYWAKDEFIAIKDKENKDLLKAHPEIEDINDHTIVEFDKQKDVMYLSKFCPKLKQGIKAMVDTGCMAGDNDNVHWYVQPVKNSDNYKVTVYEKD